MTFPLGAGVQATEGPPTESVVNCMPLADGTREDGGLAACLSTSLRPR